ncbi:hypothetical protein MKW92_010445 [Papaver armeniacum]|nr:hypothetical protein MKW92_010445 [Papaver armeniacum]
MDVEMGEKRNNEKRQEYLPLYEAAKKGDWGMARMFISDVGEDVGVTARVTDSNDTALHIAATEGHSKFVEQLVILMTPEQLETKNDDGETALEIAVLDGNIESIKAMVGKNENLIGIADREERIPIVNAAKFAPRMAKKYIVNYLYNVMRGNPGYSDLFSGDRGCEIICSVIEAGCYDVASNIIQAYADLAFRRPERGPCALEMMARSPDAFLSNSRLSFCDHLIYSCTGVGNKISRNYEAINLVKDIFNIISSEMTSSQYLEFFKETDILEIAITTGAVEFLIECLQTFPGLLWVPLNEHGHNIFSKAIMRRQENIFNLVYHVNGFQKKMAATNDKYGNTLLHLAALRHLPRLTGTDYVDLRIRRSLGSCVALQIQRDLQWFQEVESLLPLEFRTTTNNDGWTPKEIFDLHHSQPIADAEKWTKETSQSGTLVSVLIATVAFASTFTVPGGNFSDNGDITKRGIPIFLHETAFIVFEVANAVALFSSISSLLLFIGLQTSQFEDNDYLRFIPKRLMIFISIITLMVAFCATLHIILGPRFTWLPIPLSLAASIPVGLFIWSYLSLFAKMVVCTYGPSIFRRRLH